MGKHFNSFFFIDVLHLELVDFFLMIVSEPFGESLQQTTQNLACDCAFVSSLNSICITGKRKTQEASYNERIGQICGDKKASAPWRYHEIYFKF